MPTKPLLSRGKHPRTAPLHLPLCRKLRDAIDLTEKASAVLYDPHLPKKASTKISTRSRRRPAARAPRRPRPPPNHCRSPPVQAPRDLTTRKVFGRPPQERVGNQKNGPDAAPTLTRTPLRLLRRAGPSAEPASPSGVAATRGKRLYLEPQKTRPHRRPDVLAPGCGSIMSTETPRGIKGDVAR